MRWAITSHMSRFSDVSPETSEKRGVSDLIHPATRLAPLEPPLSARYGRLLGGLGELMDTLA